MDFHIVSVILFIGLLVFSDGRYDLHVIRCLMITKLAETLMIFP